MPEIRPHITETENGFIIHSAACATSNSDWRQCTPHCLVSAELVKSDVEMLAEASQEQPQPDGAAIEMLTLQDFRLLTAHLPGHIRITVENTESGNDHDVAALSLPENEGEEEYPLCGDTGYQTISLLPGELYENRSA